MGDHPRADAVEIRWPSGRIDHYTDVAVNSFDPAREADGLKLDPWVISHRPHAEIRTVRDQRYRRRTKIHGECIGECEYNENQQLRPTK